MLMDIPVAEKVFSLDVGFGADLAFQPKAKSQKPKAKSQKPKNFIA
jgi:hypothetical protein